LVGKKLATTTSAQVEGNDKWERRFHGYLLARRPSFCKKKPRSHAGHIVEELPSKFIAVAS
jgi:hypothetical protein